MSRALSYLAEALGELERQDLLRVPARNGSDTLIQLCSNDYLGYARLPLEECASSGASGSRLVSGDTVHHRAAEAAFSAWYGAEASLLFSSGYAANVGLISSLAGPGDVIFSDALNHASIIDGCRLSRAQTVVYPHLDLEALDSALRKTRGGRRFVVTESYFSMDGDAVDCAALRGVCDDFDAALLVDEAHALGVFGPRGRGLFAAAGVVADATVAPLGKAFGLSGAIVAGPSTLRSWLWNRARSFVFSTGLAPAVAASLPARVARLESDDAGRARLLASSRRLAAALGSVKAGPILPLPMRTSANALGASNLLEREGLRVQAIRFPTVPEGTARLRVTGSACLTEEELVRAEQAFARVLSFV